MATGLVMTRQSVLLPLGPMALTEERWVLRLWNQRRLLPSTKTPS